MRYRIVTEAAIRASRSICHGRRSGGRTKLPIDKCPLSFTIRLAHRLEGVELVERM